MSDTVGAALRSARERRGLTLAEVSETTKVRSHYLQALENDDISAMPSAAQARGFLRIYAEFLGLDLEKLIPPAAPVPELEVPPAPNHAAEAERASPVKSRLPQLPDLSKLVVGWRQRLADRIAPRAQTPPAEDGPRSTAASTAPAPYTGQLEPETPVPDKKKLS